MAKADIPKFQKLIDESMEKEAENSEEILFTEEHEEAVKDMLDNLEDNSRKTKGKIIFGDTVLTLNDYTKLDEQARQALRERLANNPQNVHWIFGDNADFQVNVPTPVFPNATPFVVIDIDSIADIHADQTLEIHEKMEDITEQIVERTHKIEDLNYQLEDAKGEGDVSEKEIRKMELKIREAEQELRREEAKMRIEERRMRELERQIERRQERILEFEGFKMIPNQRIIIMDEEGKEIELTLEEAENRQ